MQVALLTYRRPQQLARVLPGLVDQVDNLEVPASLMVIDNDPDGSAGPYVAGWANRSVRYVHERRPGIASARNRALAETADAAALVFIDDDEEPTDGWLAALVAQWRRYGADAVTGPVIARFEEPPSSWVTASQMFSTRKHRDGDLVRAAASNNLLLDLSAVRDRLLTFDESYTITGGEDTDFTRRLSGAGGRIIWCEAAVVLDHIPAARLTARWILRREFRSGTSFARMEITLVKQPRRSLARAALLGKGCLRVGAGLVQLIFGLLTRSPHHRARGACVAVANIGLIAGSLGYLFSEYRREPDRPETLSV